MVRINNLPRGSCVLISKDGKETPAFVRRILNEGGGVVLVTANGWANEFDPSLRIVEYGRWGRDSEMVRYVRAGDLTALGVRVHQCLRDLREQVDNVYLCVDSISHIACHVDHNTLYRFLHILSTKLKTADSTCFFMLDRPTRPATLWVVMGLSDFCLRLEDLNGEINVSQVNPGQLVQT